MGQTTRSILDICKFKCINEKLGCKEIITYSNFYNHINNCNYGEYKCNTIKYNYTIKNDKKLSPKIFTGEECQFKGIKKDIISHCEKCGLEQIFCYCCGKIFPSIIIKEHCDICYEKKGPCPYCKNQIKISKYDEHIEKFCPYVDIYCDKCKNKYLRKNITNHSKIDCLENQISHLKRENEIMKDFINKINESVQEILNKKRKRSDDIE